LTTDQRLEAAKTWLKAISHPEPHELIPVSGDASFRRYFRIPGNNQSVILMDAHPAVEDSRPFTDIASRLHKAGLNAPEIFRFDHARGFGLIEDLGDELYRDVLNIRNAEAHYPTLLDTLKRMARTVDARGLPGYDDVLLGQELELFPDWYLSVHRKRKLSDSEKNDWKALCDRLLESAAEQPRYFVHRDFHSCNLLHKSGSEPGIIDFQDGVHGPVTYDFISLIWDRYLSWPRPWLERWMMEYRDMVEPAIETATWIRWCDWMGIQRNLKIIGIFARLHYRDHKEGYLDMIPQFHRYLLDVIPRYPELASYRWLLEDPACAP
jgi:aminoglycoside/choline kinase family phosphotransferase